MQQKAVPAAVKGRGTATAPTLSANPRWPGQDTLNQIPTAAAEVTRHYHSPQNCPPRAAPLSIPGGRGVPRPGFPGGCWSSLEFVAPPARLPGLAGDSVPRRSPGGKRASGSSPAEAIGHTRELSLFLCVSGFLWDNPFPISF